MRELRIRACAHLTAVELAVWAYSSPASVVPALLLYLHHVSTECEQYVRKAEALLSVLLSMYPGLRANALCRLSCTFKRRRALLEH